MTAWMRWARGLGAAIRRSRAATPASRRSKAHAAITLEGLERREVLSNTALASFATVPVHLTSPTAPTRATFQFSAGEITSDRSNPIYLGFNALPTTGSAASPQIARVFGPAGGQRSPERKTTGEEFITKLNLPVGKPSAFAVDVLSMNNRVGDATVSAFLPGDANGDGVVDDRDIALVRAAYGSHVGQPRYNAAADFNGDGKIGCIDMTLTKKNLGARITLPPPVPTPAPAPPAPAPVPVPAPAPIVVPAPAPQPVQLTVVSAPAPVPIQTVAVAPIQLAPVQTVAVAPVQAAVPATQTVVLAPSTVPSPTLTPFNGQVVYTPLPTQAVATNAYYPQGAVSTPLYSPGAAGAPVYYQLVPASSSATAATPQGPLYMLSPAQTSAGAIQISGMPIAR